MFMILSVLLAAAPVAEDFDYLMGKETKHWEYVEKKEEIQLLKICKDIFEKNKVNLHKTNGIYKIPKVVHFIWIGPRPFPPDSITNIRSWIEHHPDWVFKFWTDRPRHPPCKGMEICYVQDFSFKFLKECYEESKNWGEKSDVLRYEILYQQGGTYADHDANALRSFDSLNKGFDFYCCFETPHPPFAGRNVTMGIGLLGSKPNHPLVEAVIHKIESHWRDLGMEFPGADGYSRTELVMRRTYMPLTQVLTTALNRDGNTDIVLPSAYFFAKSGIKSLYSKHFYCDTWSSNSGAKATSEKILGKSIDKLLKKTDRLEWLMSLMLVIGIIATISVIWRKYAQKNSSVRNDAPTLWLRKGGESERDKQ